MIKPSVEHVCFRDKEITEIHKIVVGNGDPDKSLVNKVALIGERQTTILNTLENIDGSLKSLNIKYDDTIKVATQARDAVDRFKKEEKTYEQGRNDVRIMHEKNISRWIQIIGLCVAIGMLYLGYKNLMHKNDEIGVNVKKQGMPFVTDKRGNILALPDSSQIRWFPNDSVQYTIIKNKP